MKRHQSDTASHLPPAIMAFLFPLWAPLCSSSPPLQIRSPYNGRLTLRADGHSAVGRETPGFLGSPWHLSVLKN